MNKITTTKIYNYYIIYTALFVLFITLCFLCSFTVRYFTSIDLQNTRTSVPYLLAKKYSTATPTITPTHKPTKTRKPTLTPTKQITNTSIHYNINYELSVIGCTCEKIKETDEKELDCKDFEHDYKLAQACYDKCWNSTYLDIYGLDNNHNGIACDPP